MSVTYLEFSVCHWLSLV